RLRPLQGRRRALHAARPEPRRGEEAPRRVARHPGLARHGRREGGGRRGRGEAGGRAGVGGAAPLASPGAAAEARRARLLPAEKESRVGGEEAQGLSCYFHNYPPELTCSCSPWLDRWHDS